MNEYLSYNPFVTVIWLEEHYTGFQQNGFQASLYRFSCLMVEITVQHENTVLLTNSLTLDPLGHIKDKFKVDQRVVISLL